MQHLLSFLFIVEFCLVLFLFAYQLFEKGLTFKGGISFGLLFFIFIPIWVMILTGRIELSVADFGTTRLGDIFLKDNLPASFKLFIYIGAIICFLYFPSGKEKREGSNSFKIRLGFYFVLYLSITLIVLEASGILEGGNWYANRHDFYESSGSFAVLITFILNACKVLIITSLVFKWINKEMGFYRFLILVGAFTFWDMIFTGNRIFVFCTAIIIAMIFLRKYPKKTIVLIPVLLPIVFFSGYFASIFRHMRGPLFLNGIPTPEVFYTTLKNAIKLDPPEPVSFFLGISESVNVNVIYSIFNEYEHYLFGSTYLKTLLFYIPRSVWQEKPESITVIAGDYFGGPSLVTTIIGEMHMNFSYLGIVLLPLLLWFTERVLKRMLPGYHYFGNILLFFFGILMFRMPYSDEFLVFVFVVLILFFSKLRFKYTRAS
ncbi:MAG: hypothetical protein AAGH46_01695 [Bacteroidota bacterium]